MLRMTYPELVAARQAQALRLIDVREPDEYAEVHAQGAELFPLSRIRLGELPEDDGRQVALICRSGVRSAMAAQIFEARGFHDVINVEGGTLAAIEAGDAQVVRP